MATFFQRQQPAFCSCLSFTILLSGLTLLLSSCQKLEEEPPSGTFANVYQKTLKTACIECHVPTGAATQLYGVDLDFTSQATAYQSLLTSTVSGQASLSTCGGIKIVAPGAPQSSYLAGVLFADYHTNDYAGVGGCTPYSAHLTDQNLSAAEKTSILTWIQNGARND